MKREMEFTTTLDRVGRGWCVFYSRKWITYLLLRKNGCLQTQIFQMSKVVQLLDMPCRICEGVVFVESDDGQLICEQCGTVCEVGFFLEFRLICSKVTRRRWKRTMTPFSAIVLVLPCVEKYAILFTYNCRREQHRRRERNSQRTRSCPYSIYCTLFRKFWWCKSVQLFWTYSVGHICPEVHLMSGGVQFSLQTDVVEVTPVFKTLLIHIHTHLSLYPAVELASWDWNSGGREWRGKRDHYSYSYPTTQWNGNPHFQPEHRWRKYRFAGQSGQSGQSIGDQTPQSSIR